MRRDIARRPIIKRAKERKNKFCDDPTTTLRKRKCVRDAVESTARKRNVLMSTGQS